MKVSELSGAQLDAWVAKAEGVADGLMEKDGRMCRVQEWDPEGYSWRSDMEQWKMWMDYAPSQRWDQVGPIIERERIDLEFMDDGGWRASISEWRPGWLTEHLHDVGVAYGPTPLIAAMRSYVASKFGEEVK